MRRREFLGLLGGAAAWPVAARAQQTERARRLGVLMPYRKGDAEIEGRVRALRQELSQLGWMEGSNLQLDERWTGDDMDRLRTDAASLVNGNPDAIIAVGGRVIPILMQLTGAIPIVVPGAGDAVRNGYVKNLARPGGNVTGFSFTESSVLGKTMGLLKQIAPTTSRVALVFNPDNPATVLYRQLFETFAPPLAVEPIVEPIHDLADINRVIATLAKNRNGAALFPADITTTAIRHDIIALVERHRVPAIYSDVVFVKDGGLASYSSDRKDLFRRAAGYVDRILRGEKAGDLPFQQPTKYIFMVNLRAARNLGLEFPPTVLATADEVIE